MTKEKVLKIIGIVGVAGGSACLYFAGITEGMVATLVGGVFVIIGIILGFFKKA